MVAMLMMVMVMVVKEVGNPFFVGFCTVFFYYSMFFGYHIVLVQSSYVDFYVLWSSQSDGGQSRCVAMGLLMSTGFGPVLSDPVWTWPVRSGQCVGRRGMVGSLWGSACAEHGPVWDKSG